MQIAACRLVIAIVAADLGGDHCGAPAPSVANGFDPLVGLEVSIEVLGKLSRWGQASFVQVPNVLHLAPVLHVMLSAQVPNA